MTSLSPKQEALTMKDDLNMDATYEQCVAATNAVTGLSFEKARKIWTVMAAALPSNPAEPSTPVAEPVTDEMVEAAQAKYREMAEKFCWRPSWPAVEAMREILEAALSAPSVKQDAGWRGIETAPDNEVCLFWLDWADGCPANGSLTDPEIALYAGKYGGWPHIFKAISWLPSPTPPQPSEEVR